jgi:hypothetical protein
MRQWHPRRLVIPAIVVVAALVVVVSVAALVSGPGGPPNRNVSVSAAGLAAVDLSDVPGKLTIVGTAGSAVTLTGSLNWTGRAPLIRTRRNGSTLHLTYRCAPHSPCTENYRLAVPRRTALVLRQPSGQVTVSGLSGSLRIIARSVNVAARDLRDPALAAVITSGHLSASFAAVPRRLSVALTHAQATVWLPGRAGYAVRTQVTSGYVRVGVRRSPAPAPTVTALVDSGELNLLPA